MPTNKKKLNDKLISDLLYIHEDIKDILDIDSEIGNCFLDKENYKADEIKLLDFKLFLTYVDYVAKDIDRKIGAFKLANVRNFKQKMATYKDRYTHMKSIIKVSERQQDAVESIYESVIEVKLKLNSVLDDLIKEEKGKLLQRSLIVDGIFATVYTTAVLSFTTDIGTKIMLLIFTVYGFLIIHGSLKKYYDISNIRLKKLHDK